MDPVTFTRCIKHKLKTETSLKHSIASMFVLLNCENCISFGLIHTCISIVISDLDILCIHTINNSRKYWHCNCFQMHKRYCPRQAQQHICKFETKLSNAIIYGSDICNQSINQLTNWLINWLINDAFFMKKIFITLFSNKKCIYTTENLQNRKLLFSIKNTMFIL